MKHREEVDLVAKLSYLFKNRNRVTINCQYQPPGKSSYLKEPHKFLQSSG